MASPMKPAHGVPGTRQVPQNPHSGDRSARTVDADPPGGVAMVNTPQQTWQVGAEPDDELVRARIACLDVIATFFRLIDTGQATKALELFTDDAELIVGGMVASGDHLRRALLDEENDGVRRVYLPGESSFWLVTPNVALADTPLQVFQFHHGQGTETSAFTITHIRDRFVRNEQRVWRVSRRVVTVLAGGV
ncbi:nuclear transport factor 2 family protein [Streptomyces sp. NPDC057636]|uniref:nuclear transport factor 2 family protein n=1 Tax=Streptomyces sp. NPDC057636 TaxID=3346189 RepID=UPI003699659C